MTVLDQKNRLDSLNPLHSVCVTAPAGSGKTELLIQRILVLLARVNKPEEILAITFTRKAAAEMHLRIVAALEFAQSSEQPSEEHKKLTWTLARNAMARNKSCGWQLLENPKRLKIQTIDGFCASLTRHMPILSKFGSQPQIANSADKYYQLAARNFLASMESQGNIAEQLMILMAHLDNNMARVESLLVSLLQRRDQWLVHIVFSGHEQQVKAKLEDTAMTVIRDTLASIHKELQIYAGELLPLLDYAGTNLQAAHSDSPVCLLAGISAFPSLQGQLDPAWLAIADLLLTSKNGWRKSVNLNNGFPTQTIEGDKTAAKALKSDFTALLQQLATNDALLETLIALRHLPAAQYSHSQWRLLEALTVLLPMLTAELQIVFQQYGEVDYIQVAIAALQSLGGEKAPSDLLLKLDYQLQHILLDEFQDTSSSQFDLLKRLVEGWNEHNHINPEAPKTLFIVGDGMQSIYAFRAANVGLFLEARKYGVNQLQLEDLPLSVNFRSTDEIVSWINHVFQSAFPPKDNIARGAVRYEPSTAFKGSLANSGVSINGFTGDNATALEAAYIAERVKQQLQLAPQQSIAILVRSRNHLLEIIPALKSAGVQWSATEIDPLAQYSFISDLLILTRALANLHDRVAWAAFLRSPYCGLNNKDLHSILGNNYASIWHALNHIDDSTSLSQFARHKLEYITQIIQQAHDDRWRKPFRVLIEGVWLKLGGASLLNNYQHFLYIDDFFDLLEEFEKRGGLKDMNEFEQSVTKLYASSTGNANVHLMTIHKAKGLEFDCVFLPGLSRATRSNSKDLLMWREYLSEQHSGLIMAPLSATGEKEGETYKHLYYEQAIASALENTRLLYVACTRAISQLELTFTFDDDSKSPQNNTLLHTIWPTVKESIQWHSSSGRGTGQLGLDFDTSLQQSAKLQRISTSWQPPGWSFPNPLSAYYLQAEYSEEQNQPLIINNLPKRVFGTVIHSILERLVTTGIEFWLKLHSEQRVTWITRLLQANGLYQDGLQEYATEVIRHINNTVTDSKGSWILSREHAYSQCELALLGIKNGEIKRKTIDRCFIDKAGDLWIIDYKSAQPQTDEPDKDFIDRECIEYRMQLNSYKTFINNYAGVNPYNQIRMAIYFTHFPFFQEVN